MLAFLIRWRVSFAAPFAAALALTFFIVIGCEQSPKSVPSPRPTERSTVSDSVQETEDLARSRPANVQGGTLWPLVRSADTIIIAGEVTGLVDKLYPPDPHAGGEPPPPGHPKDQPGTPLATPRFVYSLTVSQVISASQFVAGATVNIIQEGVAEDVVYHSDIEGESLSYTMTDALALHIGKRYLFFLSSDESGNLVGQASGRFVFDMSGRLRPIDDSMVIIPAVESLTGLTVDEAAAVIEAAVAEAAAAPQP